MKKKIIVCILCMACLLIGVLLSSCDGGDLPDSEPESELVIPSGVEMTIIWDATAADAAAEDYVLEIYNKITDNMDTTPMIFSGSSAKQGYEIVLGSSSRAITKKAEEMLSEKLAADGELFGCDDMIGCAVYAEGDSVAVVWSSGFLKDVALDYLLFLITDEGINLREGDFTTDTVSFAAYIDERDAEIKSAAWDKLAEVLPEEGRREIIAELRALYSMYSPDMIVWLANLYDPATGGFYCSNSARDNEPFLPDIESTWSGFSLVGSTGAAELYGGDWVKALPEWVKERAADWIYSLQDPDGFFYHPQWPKEYIEANNRQSRITRDYNSARTVLQLLGRKPKYTGYSVVGNLTNTLGGSSAVAVSKLVSAGAVLPQYESDEAFYEHLLSLERAVENVTDERRAYKFYEYGNSFQSTTGFMSDNMKDMLEDFFDRNQNPENGMWSEGLYFNSTNGIHKIAAVYNYIGKELKYIDKIVESTITVLTFDPEERPAQYVVDMYNAWSAFPYIYTNITKFADGTPAEREARCLEIKEKVFENAALMISISRVNLERFAYPDGSFGYYPTSIGSGGTAQGCPNAVAGSKEGNLDGTGIAMTSLTNCIFGAFELSRYRIPIFTERERLVYVSILEELDREYRENKS